MVMVGMGRGMTEWEMLGKGREGGEGNVGQ